MKRRGNSEQKCLGTMVWYRVCVGWRKKGSKAREEGGGEHSSVLCSIQQEMEEEKAKEEEKSEAQE